ncbi:MAG: hypothetical protein A3K77_04610 [Euryarchaeota archaeon RBG_13_31_8]|nr:MAG: hypothetical protein A3K77_04610 [Euryarchaeota archaeon RBG_13_31_8]
MIKFLGKISPVAFDNSFDTDSRAWVPEIWAQETLMILEGNVVAANLVHRDFENVIASLGDTVNTRMPGTFSAKRKGVNDDVTVQAATATKVPVVLNQHVHTSFVIKDGEESLSLADLVETYIKPAAISLSDQLDRIVLGQVYQYLDNQVAIDPDGADDIKDAILDLRNKMNVNKVPVEGRNLILAPATETEALKLDLFISADKIGDEGTAMREASLGKKLGFSTYMCQNTPSLTSGTYTTPANGAAGDVNGGEVAGSSTVTVVTDATAIMYPGMYVTFEDDGGVYRLTTVAATELTLDRPLLSALADDTDVNYYTRGDVDLAGHSGTTSYPIGYIKEINIAAAGVIPQVGQLVGFTDSDAAPVRAGEYCIIDVSTGSGAGDYFILLDRPLEAALEDGDKVCYGPKGNYNFAFDRNALALVVRPLALPRAGAGAIAGVADYNGLAVRVTITYEGRGQGHLVTLDLLCGVKVLDVNRGAVLVRNAV